MVLFEKKLIFPVSFLLQKIHHLQKMNELQFLKQKFPISPKNESILPHIGVSAGCVSHLCEFLSTVTVGCLPISPKNEPILPRDIYLPRDILYYILRFLVEKTINGFKFDEKEDGVWKWWHDNGQLSWEENWKDGKQNGIRRSWRANGKLHAKDSFVDGKKNGRSLQWYDTGEFESQGFWKNNKKHGHWIRWLEDGTPWVDENWKDGEEVEKTYFDIGTYKIRNYGFQLKKGKLESEQIWKNGKKDGVWTEWYQNGQIKSKITWKDGKKDGRSLEWFETGKLESQQIWKNGKRMDIYKYKIFRIL